MTNRIALYVLLAALLLAALTNRWMARGGGPAFNIVSFDGIYFLAQWVAFAMTVGALLLLLDDWRDTGRFPRLILLGVALLAFFIATGIPLTQAAQEWKSGDVGLTRWLRLLQERKAENAIAPTFLGTWKSATRSYVIERDAVVVRGPGGTVSFGAERCPTGLWLSFHHATDVTFHFNPAAKDYAALLAGPPIPALEVACDGDLYTFLRLPDGRTIVFHGLQNPNPWSETLSRES